MNYFGYHFIERPEEELDNRTLYERLQEQKEKKQEEWEEQHKLSKYCTNLLNTRFNG